METTALKKFAQGARRQLLEQVTARLEQVLRTDSVEIREKATVVAELKVEIEKHGKQVVIDRVAYTWFNRFCALRFMDVNHYTRIGVITPVEGFTQPEILQEAKQGHIDDDLSGYLDPNEIFGLLNGQRPSSDAQGEAYRLLLVGICKSYYEEMPFLFEKIEDYTELLMPLDLLSENSVLHDLREALSPEACQDVEVIGWLYQYYISERKDKVFEALKQNQKIEAVDIPAATQLFTPHWIVRYLVENSLGRLWMLNHPNSGLREKMEYYIAPAQEETDFLRISSPEELRLLDPACGSGHILTYAFDLLAAIYEEEGYASSDIPKLILEKNIFGVEIDPRAGALAAFALVMKARAKDRRFFTRDVSPNICVLENVTFNDAELKQYMNAVGRDLFTEPLMETLRQFEQADNFGSLIRPMLTDAGYVRGLLEGKNLGGDLFLFGVHERVLKVLKQAEFLTPRYHVVVANPPYLGNKGMNSELRDYVLDQYPDTKIDLCVAFIERNIDVALSLGYISMITMQSWMFLPSFENFRKTVLTQKYILSMAHLGVKAFDTIGGEIVSTTAFVIHNAPGFQSKGIYYRLVDGNNEAEKQKIFHAIKNLLQDSKELLYKTSAKEITEIPGSPIAYWVSPGLRSIFTSTTETLGDITISDGQTKTGDNDKYLRKLWEVNKSSIGSPHKWWLHPKGGSYRRWFGNVEWVVDWSEEARKHYRADRVARIQPEYLWHKKGICWSNISGDTPAFRLLGEDEIFNVNAPTIYFKDETNDENLYLFLGLLNTKLASYLFNTLNPTISLNIGEVQAFPNSPLFQKVSARVRENVMKCLEISQEDWNSFETSWGFVKHPLLHDVHKRKLIVTTYQELRRFWNSNLSSLQKLEQELNQILIDTYSLERELTAEVSSSDLSLLCNPHYRYAGDKSETELETLLLADTMKEFISYAVGCMFGRYSLDKPGLVLANQGETLKDYLKQVPKPTFTPDEDNVIPVLEGEWFEDDIAERFKKFLRVTFVEDHYDENLAFIEEAIGRDVRSYFIKEFYKDHVQTYKKRPIYWMFSSPKGSFNALIYMHRYQPDTVSIVLNGYLREYIKKLTAHKSQLERTSVSGSASQSQKTKALKEMAQVSKVLAELKEYEKELYTLASQKIQIDLDDGVKVNYGKFGEALSPIKGL